MLRTDHKIFLVRALRRIKARPGQAEQAVLAVLRVGPTGHAYLDIGLWRRRKDGDMGRVHGFAVRADHSIGRSLTDLERLRDAIDEAIEIAERTRTERLPASQDPEEAA